MDIWWYQQETSCHIQNVFISFSEVSSYLLCVPSFKSLNSSSVCKKNMMWIIPLPPLVSNYMVRISWRELGIFDLFCLLIHWITIYFLSITFCKLFCLTLCGTKSFVLKTELYFIFFEFVLGIWYYSIKGCVFLLLFL